MDPIFATIRSIHAIFGREVLSVLIVAAAIYLAFTYRPNAPRSPVARIFPVLIDIQVTLGLIYWLVGIFAGVDYFLSFPFILHPLLGFATAVVAHLLIGARSPFARLGRWAAPSALGIILVLVLSNVMIAMMA
ncbi:MAG TPA: hypothetical protein DEF43_09340 [Chloroflexus aurantiacus]|jgi:hypothetical protein|uniref:Uncharacterized protein n=1 Tax=Chloroflexus aurantiacus (strain ATCC 29366 / DSM 635 / J-10-fl) TaxID=324602 RepID=A9WAD4_CHLAA|nr:MULTISPECIES: hypothetical protein [Chloroflexus]ABY34693.1 hypothetical protein Caur_1465 [Chloroflexus aurantiacus J-10-fl]RMG48451.1 MAG: hypothetical protein D6716_13260 [Chloroflexota bacterium]HBW67347.1 hypothetical protein [Chloroflexus aurantiacus]